MRNIIKAQLYQLRFNKLTWFVFIGVILIGIARALFEIQFSALWEETLRGCDYAAQNISIDVMCGQFFLVVCAAQMCGADFNDKTTNYELMAGHMRWQVYFGRVIPCIVMSVVGYLVVICVPTLLVTAVCGWGTQMSAADMVFRLFMISFPVMRYACELSLVCFISKNQFVVMGAGYLMFMMGIIPQLTESSSVFLAITNLNKLCSIEAWTSFGLSGDIYYVYEAELSTPTIVGTIAVSTLVSACCVLLGYVFFKNDDHN